MAVVTQPDKPAGRGAKLRAPAVKMLALQHKLRVFQPKSLKREQAQLCAELGELGSIDLGVVVAFGQLIPQALLDLPKRACLNVHASLLPRWRGAAPIQRAILSGDDRTGVCLMQMDAGLDTGAVYSSQEQVIEAKDNFGSLHDKLADIGAKLLLRDLEAIAQGTMRPVPQSENGVTYADKIKQSETQINWQKPALEIERQVRAFAPSPGAFTMLNNMRLKVFEGTRKSPRHNVNLVPGRLHFVDRLTLEIETGADVLSVYQVQAEGRNRLNIKEFLLGAKLDQNVIFGK